MVIVGSGLFFVGFLMLLIALFLQIRIWKNEDYGTEAQGKVGFWTDCANNKLRKSQKILGILGIICIIVGTIILGIL